MANWAIESQLQNQREGLLGILEGGSVLEGLGEQSRMEKAERAILQLRGDLDGLSRVLTVRRIVISVNSVA